MLVEWNRNQKEKESWKSQRSQGSQRKNQITLENISRQMKIIASNFIGFSKNCRNMEVNCDKYLHYKEEKFQINNINLHFNELEKKG